MNFTNKIAQNRRGFVIASAVLFLAFLTFFLYLYRQVDTAFETPLEFIPTRIYSSVTRIAPPMARGTIERKIRALGYSVRVSANELSIILHSTRYPDFLIPDQHPTLSLRDKRITFQFDGKSPTSPLASIRTDNGTIDDVYLEPEFVATLSADKNQIREVLKFEEFPEQIPLAVMAAEDNRFYEHFGIDPRGFLRAIFVDIKTLSLSQGGSTITQQLVKNLMERRNRNLFMKINELFLAPVLEIKYSKKQIFERYLNEVFLGQIGSFEIRGFSEGAKYFYGKSVSELNTGEIALLVGLIKGPAFYSPHRHMDRAKTRQRYVLERMLETGRIKEDEFQRALKQPIRLAKAPQAGNRAPYFVDYVKAELTGLLKDRFDENEIPELGLQVYTTLDLGLNQIAQEALQRGLESVETRLKLKGVLELQGAVAAVDHTSGEIRTLIGGRNYGKSNFNRILNMKRQAGSTFKPLVYATAFRTFEDERGNSFTPAYPLLDREWGWTYDPKQPIWKPSNYEKEKLGWIPLKSSIAKSINTTAARVAKRVGLAEIAETAKLLGMSTRVPEVPSITLGSVEVNPLELLEVYMTFANHGKGGDPYVIKAIQNPDGSEFYRSEYRASPRIDPGVADMMTYLLQGVFTDGTASFVSQLGFDRPAAGKTGTTNDYRDSWFVGYTPQLTALVWAGLDQGLIEEAISEARKKDKTIPKRVRLTGASAALPVWVEIMKRTLQYEPALPFPESDHLVDMRLDSRSGQRATESCPESQVVLEKVIIGREPKKTTCLPDFEPPLE